MAFNSGRRNYDDEENSVSNTHSDGTSHSYLGKTLKITGEITSDEFLTIEGKIDGNIDISKTLTIGENGYVNGKISAETVKIDGKAKGTIDAKEKLQISSNGVFQGNLKSGKLVIKEGAVFQGNANLED